MVLQHWEGDGKLDGMTSLDALPDVRAGLVKMKVTIDKYVEDLRNQDIEKVLINMEFVASNFDTLQMSCSRGHAFPAQQDIIQLYERANDIAIDLKPGKTKWNYKTLADELEDISHDLDRVIEED